MGGVMAKKPASPSSFLKKKFQSITVSGAISAFVVAVSCLFVFSQLQPHLLLMNSTTNGGDMGAHVWLPDFVKNHLLPHGRVTGWTPDWYAGFPASTFYFPLPTLMIVALSFIVPSAIAFKLVTISGVVTIPLSAYLFGRFARLPFPAPACLAVATVPFLFDTGYTILGGNIASTLAGEFSFSISLSISLVFLGLVAGGLDTGRRRWAAALLFAAVILSHILPALFALVGGTLLVLLRLITGTPKDVPLGEETGLEKTKTPWRIRRFYLVGVTIVSLAVAMSWLIIDQRMSYSLFDRFLQALFLIIGIVGVWVIVRAAKGTVPVNLVPGRLAPLRWAIPVGIFGLLTTGFWLIPFIARSPFMNDMGWEKIGNTVVNGQRVAAGMKLYGRDIYTYTDALFPNVTFDPFSGDLLLGMALVSAGVAFYLQRRIATFIVLLGIAFAIGFVVAPQGRLWNARLLPFWYLSLYLLAGLLIAEAYWAIKKLIQLNHKSDDSKTIQNLLPLALVPVFLISMLATTNDLPKPTWFPNTPLNVWHDPARGGVNFIPSWAKWNYGGYDGRQNGQYLKAAYPEYKTLVDTMYDVGKTNGCGRAMWEYEPSLDRFGTPMALMLLPMHTKGCIGSMEGLFFESSPSVPYHFLNQALMSTSPSSAMRDLPYGTLDVADGVTRLQLMGVKYYMAVTPAAQQQAATDPRLRLVSTVAAAPDGANTDRTWNIYEVSSSDLVAPLANLPAVMTHQDHVKPIVHKKNTAEDMTSQLAWLENAVKWYQEPALYDVPLAASGPSNWPRIENADDLPQRIPTQQVNVEYISVGDDRISFRVDKPGTPVVVKASYFPNWQAHGAQGPYRITPNLMVVVPTQKDVTLHYGRTPVDWYGIIATLIGLTGIVWLWRRDRRQRRHSPKPRSNENTAVTINTGVPASK